MNPRLAEVREKGIHEAFVITVMLKAAGALAETILGLLLVWSTNVVELVLALIQSALIDDPDDFFATHFQSVLSPSPDALHFGGLYLLSHGVVKLVLSAGLLRDKLWAYPASLAVFALFIAYQCVRWLHTHSVLLLALTVYDLVVMWLIWHEYREHTRTPVVQ